MLIVDAQPVGPPCAPALFASMCATVEVQSDIKERLIRECHRTMSDR
jgi:hypothetical protein